MVLTMASPDEPTGRVPEPPPEAGPPERRRRTSTALIVEDFRSVRRWLVLLGLTAVLATVMAIYALLRAGDSESRSADKQRVATLERTLNRRSSEIDKRLNKTSSSSETNRIERRLRGTGEESDVAKLDRRLRRVEKDLTDAVGGAASAGKALVQVQRRLDRIERQIRALRRRR